MSIGQYGQQCGTPGCDGTGHGISIMISNPSVYRCRECLACMNALAPRWIDGLTDRAAYDATAPATRRTQTAQLRFRQLVADHWR